MRRALTTFAVLLGFPAAADAASVKVVDCVPALEQDARATTFEARMRAVRGSERMQVRFTLQVRADDILVPRWRRVAAPGFDQWLTSDPGVGRYVYDKTVQNLAAPAGYRTIVRFRWLDADGLTVKSARVTSASCRQPDLRPSLVPTQVDVAPGADADHRRYTVTLRNNGRSDAVAPFDVTLSSGSEQPARAVVLGLDAGAFGTVTFTAPVCTADAPLTITVDAADAVDERDEEDNVVVTPCVVGPPV
jgi:hypothetical protein